MHYLKDGIENGDCKGLTIEQIDKLNKCKYKEGEEDDTCSICWNKYTVNDNLIVLGCTGEHRFHKDCLIPWLQKTTTCPVCRYEFTIK